MFRKIRDLNNSSVAQLVEQMTVNHWVTGSSPVGGANIKALAFYDDGAFLFALISRSHRGILKPLLFTLISINYFLKIITT